MRFALVASMVLAACAPSLSEIRGPVDRDIAQRAELEPVTDAQIDALLAKPLDVATAQRIALASSPRLAAAMAELGIARGELAGATLGAALGPTHVDLALRFGPGSGHHEYELDVIQDLAGLFEKPRRSAAADATLAAARATVTAMALRLAARVELAVRAVLVAQQEVELRQTAFDAADAAATLRERMHAAGGTTDLAQARDRAAREQARIDLARAEAAVETSREAVTALLGLSGSRTKWTATGNLPDAPATAPSLDDLEAAAVTASLDLVAARSRADAAANRAGAERVRAVLPDLGAGISVIDHAASHDSGVSVGPAIRIGIPLFDQRGRDRAIANADASRTEHEFAAVAIELRSHARVARLAAVAAYQEVRHVRDVILPLRQQIVDETLAHYNAMDANPFELIAARRDLADAGHEYLEALAHYHAAMTRVTALRRGVDLDEEHAP